MAAELRSLRSGADLPRPEFIDALRARLADQAGAARRPGLSRRALLAGGGVAAAALVAGMALERALPDGTVKDAGGPSPRRTLAPDPGRWVAVATLASLADGAATRFTAGPVEGFLVRRGEAVDALSAVCTHMGCILQFNAAGRRLDCPCHGAAFGLDGMPLTRGYLDGLPRLESRLNGGSVEILVPA